MEFSFPRLAALFRLDLGEGACNARPDFADRGFLVFGVLFDEHLAANFLFGRGGKRDGGCMGHFAVILYS